jgi:dsDNA-specific endonuclease/ATPase MutS2
MNDDDPVEIPIDGILDLHTFHPRDVKSLVPHYLELCQDQNIIKVRIIHGKGTGTLRRTVHSLLEKNKRVASYRLDDGSGGGWGATLVNLHPA